MKAMRTAPVAKLVVVIDDDPLVLEATGGLLRSWGCCVVAGKSCDEAVVRLAETEAGRQPDLIVCDYQLSRGLTGVDAFERPMLRGFTLRWSTPPCCDPRSWRTLRTHRHDQAAARNRPSGRANLIAVRRRPAIERLHSLPRIPI